MSLAAKAMGTTTAGLQKMLENGEVISSEFLPKFAKQLRDFSAKGLTDATSSFNAEVGRSKTAFQEFLQTIGDAGLLDIFRFALQTVRVALMAVQGPITALVSGFNYLITPLKLVSGLFVQAKDDLDQGKEGLEGVTFSIKALGVVLAAVLLTPLAKFAMKIGLVSKLLGPAIAALAAFKARMLAVSLVVGKSGAALVAMGMALKGIGLIATKIVAPLVAIATMLEVVELATTDRHTVFHTMAEKIPMIGVPLGLIVDQLARAAKWGQEFLGATMDVVAGTESLSGWWDRITGNYEDILNPVVKQAEIVDWVVSKLESMELTLLKVKRVWASMFDRDALPGLNEQIGRLQLEVDSRRDPVEINREQDISREFGGKMFGGTRFRDESLNEKGVAKLTSVLSNAFNSGTVSPDASELLSGSLGVSTEEMARMMDAVSRLKSGNKNAVYGLRGSLKSEGLDNDSVQKIIDSINIEKSGPQPVPTSSQVINNSKTSSTQNVSNQQSSTSNANVTYNQYVNIDSSKQDTRHDLNVATREALIQAQTGGYYG